MLGATNKKLSAVDRLPLASVRTFVVVARLLSISRAAEELSVTPSAVSYQIRILENYLGTPLFHRRKNRLKLTLSGEHYNSEACEALQRLARATSALQLRRDKHVLRLGVPPSLGALWLMPRLAVFAAAQPDVALTITASADPGYHLGSAFDVAICYGHGELSGLHVSDLGRNHMFPVCKRSMTTDEPALRRVADLRQHTLLDSCDPAYYRYGSDRIPLWSDWLTIAAVEVNGARKMNLTPPVLMHSAVKSGTGVGLSRSLLAVDQLVAGDIAIPFGPVVPLTTTYHFVAPSPHLKRKEVAALRDWLMAECITSHNQLEPFIKAHLLQSS